MRQYDSRLHSEAMRDRTMPDIAAIRDFDPTGHNPEALRLRTLRYKTVRYTMKPQCPYCGSTKLRRVVAKKRQHLKYIPRNATRCLYCKRSWWLP